MKTIVAFDFDGTLTTQDTFGKFIQFTKGNFYFYCNVPFISFIWLLSFVKIRSTHKAKEFIFSHCFKGMSLIKFNQFSVDFVKDIDKMLQPKAIQAIEESLSHGFEPVIVSASVTNWILPWAQSKNIQTVIGTMIEVDSNENLTGKFSSKNCVKQEKVNRLLELYPNRSNYKLVAYGNSSGDKQLIDFADEGFYNQLR
jgi:HAD superfamily hydrolase (TIGR01490 family)